MLTWEIEDREASRLDGIELLRRSVLSLVWLVIAAAAAAGAVVAGLAVRTQSSFQSDDVAQIVALMSWTKSGITTYYAGSNNYTLRLPVVKLVLDVTDPGKHQLLVLTAVLVAIAAVVLTFAARAQAQSAMGALAGVLAVAWVVSNPGVVDAIARPTVRNFELGVAALGLVGLDRMSERSSRPRWLLVPVLAVGIALFLWNDPYFLFIVTVPAIGFAALGAALARSLWRVVVAATLAAGALGSRLLDAAGTSLGVDALEVPFKYPKPADRQRAKDLLFKQLPNAIGTKPMGTQVTEQQAFANRLVIALLIVSAILALVWCVRRWRDLPAGTLTAAFMIVLPGLAWYASGNMLVDDRSWRYMMMTPFVLPILLSPAAAAIPRGIRPLFLGLSAVVIGFSLWCNLVPAKDLLDCGLAERCVPTITTDVEQQDNRYAAWLQNYGVTKVLVPYWHSNTTAYLSEGKVPAVTIDCDKHRLVTWRWLTTDARIQEPVGTSQLVLEGGHAAGCSQADIVAQLGPPVSITKFSDYQLWAYRGDIAARLPTRKG